MNEMCMMAISKIFFLFPYIVQLRIKADLGSFISIAMKRATIIIVYYATTAIEVVVSCINCP